MGKLRIVALWVTALAVTTGLTWQIVSAANGQVGERQLAVLADGSSIGGSDASSESTSTSPSTSTSSTSVTSTTTPANTTNPTTGTSTSVTGGAGVEWSVKTVNTAGGTVVIRSRPEEVELLSAVAAPGYDVEVDDQGPPRVRVEFESASDDVRVEARWRDGRLEITES